MRKNYFKNNLYFGHDNDMRHDKSIKYLLRKKYSLEGYAIWCMLLEVLCREEEFKYELTDLNIRILSDDFEISKEKLVEIIDFLCSKEVKLLVKENNFIYSKELIRRMNYLLDLKDRARKAVQVRWDKQKNLDVYTSSNTNSNTSGNTVNKEINKEINKNTTAKRHQDYTTLSDKELEVLEPCYKLAILLFKLVKRNNPNSICKPECIEKWARSIRLLNVRDKQPYKLIYEVILWCQNDTFWRTNIRSGDKLREQWDTLTSRMNVQQSRFNENYSIQKVAELRREEEERRNSSSLNQLNAQILKVANEHTIKKEKKNENK